MILFSGLCWVMFHTAILSDSRSLLVTGISCFMFVDFLSNLILELLSILKLLQSATDFECLTFSVLKKTGCTSTSSYYK